MSKTRTKTVDFDYGKISPGYYDLLYRRRKGMQSKFHHLRFDRVRREMGDYQRHLDVGCGPGTFIGGLTPERYSVGVDVAAPQIDYARDHYSSERHQFQCVEAGKPLPFTNNSFDVVTLMETIEHMAEDESVFILNEIYRVLKPGTGRILLTTPNDYFIYRIVEWLRDQLAEVSYEEQHIIFYDRLTLDSLLNLAGFRRVTVSAYQFTAPFYAGINWKLADWIEKIEPKFVTARYGFLLLGSGYKN